MPQRSTEDRKRKKEQQVPSSTEFFPDSKQLLYHAPELTEQQKQCETRALGCQVNPENGAEKAKQWGPEKETKMKMRRAAGNPSEKAW